MSCKNWYFKVKELLNSLDWNIFTRGSFECSKSYFLQRVTDKLEQKHRIDWLNAIQKNAGNRGRGGNKLRGDCLFKSLFKSDYQVEPYCELFLPLKHRSALSKFRRKVAHLRLETGRYEGFGFEGRIWDLIVSVPDHCLSFYLRYKSKNLFYL